MKFYQLIYLITPDFSEEELKNFSKKVGDFILTEGGSLNRTAAPNRKKLAYPIKEKTEAFLATLNFYLNPEGFKNFEKKLKLEKQILRYILLTKKVPKKIIPERVRDRKKPPEKMRDKKVELEEINKKIEEILKE